MQFKLSFGHFSTAVPEKDRPGGLALVDLARKETGVPLLHIDVIPSLYESGSGIASNISLSEKTARRACGLFNNAEFVHVEMEEGTLARFCYLTCTSVRNEETGKVSQIKWVWKFKQEDVINAWVKAGCPLKWDGK